MLTNWVAAVEEWRRKLAPHSAAISHLHLTALPQDITEASEFLTDDAIG